MKKLEGTINLIFEKAIDEPNFSVPYANMCKQLALVSIKNLLLFFFQFSIFIVLKVNLFYLD